MQYPQFLELVRSESGLDSPEQAAQASHATLAVLAERLTSGAARHLADQLPEELAGDLRARPEEAKPFQVDEFYDAIADREEIDRDTAADHATGVLRALNKAVSRDEIDDIRAQLPDQLRQLLIEDTEEAATGRHLRGSGRRDDPEAREIP